MDTDSSPLTIRTRQNDPEGRFNQLKREIHKLLIQGMNISSIGTMPDYELRRELRRGIEQLCHLRSELISQADRERLIHEVIDETLGLGPIEPLLRDPTVSDILINGPKTVYVERRGRLEQTPIVFHDVNHLLEIVQRVASRVGRRLDESSPMVDARLKDGSRVNAVIAPLAIDGALVSIRKFGSRPLMAADLVARHSVTREMIAFLSACIQARLNIMISGGTGSGKTTFLNALSAFISPHERIATIEDAAELQLQQPHIARMETRPPNLEGKGAITARDLLRNSLRMRPDRIVVGECRGEEAFDMLQAMTTGHDGSLTTIHANETRDAISRLEMLVGMAGYDLPIWFIQRQIVSAINIIVHCSRVSGGQRKVVQISELTGMQGNEFTMHDLFVYEQSGINQEGNAVGEFRATGIRPQCLEKLKQAGIDLPAGLFKERTMPLDRIDDLQYRSRP
ncbi:MAG TPA: CpaF family protein [Planctomicrobium sp.]|nr:CpaF family protein [Planctomicrobium sp.]